MKTRLFSAIVPAAVICLALVAAYTETAFAQDADPAQQTQGGGGWQGQRGGRGGGGFGMMGGGRGTMGTVTEVAADHYTIKTETGETYTVHFSANTRIMKQMVRRRAAGDARDSGDAQPAAPQPLKPSDIKVGDIIAANGELDAAAKSVGAVFIVQIDPERAKQMREMEANYGKTWLMGKVTAIDGVKVTLDGAIDKIPHTVMADENTTFRRRREPITLADVQVGDMVRVEGAVKDGGFLATTIAVMGRPPQEGTPMVPRGNPPQ
ncbi:MAG: DUF5666 domain-containing protein [Terracidiphilus sp.]